MALKQEITIQQWLSSKKLVALKRENNQLNYKITEWDAKILYELFEQRSGTNATIFVGQYPVDEWHDRLGGGTQADSIMDRIVYNAYEIPTNETNLRKIYDTKRLQKLVDSIEKYC